MAATLCIVTSLSWRSAPRVLQRASTAVRRSVTTLSLAPISIGDASASQAEDISRVVNWAYRGKHDGGDARAWTGERHLLSGVRITADAARAQIDRCGAEEALLVATSSTDELLGTVTVTRVAPTVAEIGMLSVDPDVQAQGVGGRLLDAAEERAAAFGAASLVMYVIDSRDDLLHWYARKGYEPCPDAPRVPFPVEAGVGTPWDVAANLQFMKIAKDASR